MRIFKSLRDKLDNFKPDLIDDLKITANNIYLNSHWSACVFPVLEPMLEDDGLIIGVVSVPSDTDSSTDITDQLYDKETIKSFDIVKAFFDCNTPMDIININNGFVPYVILKKKLGNLFFHYFLNSEMNDFVQGFKKRSEAKSSDILTKTNFPGLQMFNAKYNKENNIFVERIYIWYCCWHNPITDEVIKQATDEALKLKSLLSFLQERNIYLKQHESFDEFKDSALNLFEMLKIKGKTK